MHLQTQTIPQHQSDNITTLLHNNFSSLLIFIFYAQWNQSSKKLLLNLNNNIPIFGQYDNVKYYSLSAQRCPQIFKKYQVQKTPTIIFTQTNKKILYRYDGQDIGPVFDQLAKVSQEYKVQFQKDKSIWYPKIKNIIQSAPVLVFINGSPQNTKCASTRTLLQILKTNNIQYTYYDIMQNQQIKNWLQHYTKTTTTPINNNSNNTTHNSIIVFPCIFINTKYIGGVDKIKQLTQNGQLIKIIPQNCRLCTAEQKYNKFINMHETIVFIDGFLFENVQSQNIVTNTSKKYGDKIMIYNVAIDKLVKNYVTDKINKYLPFVIHNKECVKVQ